VLRRDELPSALVRAIRLTGDDWLLLRAVRLAALADAPYAYGSTLAHEVAFDEAEWRRRLDTALWVAAVDDAEPAAKPTGLVGIYTPAGQPPMLIAMWVDPNCRGRGVGDLLLSEILRQASENGWSEVVLRVADGNDAARNLFLRHGFVPTGERTPLESDPGVATETLSRAL
jgi:ribosomal protein S18 acetylase RimI-like enzyme